MSVCNKHQTFLTRKKCSQPFMLCLGFQAFTCKDLQTCPASGWRWLCESHGLL